MKNALQNNGLRTSSRGHCELTKRTKVCFSIRKDEIEEGSLDRQVECSRRIRALSLRPSACARVTAIARGERDANLVVRGRWEVVAH